MEETAQRSVRSNLPAILIAAMVEGWGLYGLHHAIRAPHWPAADPAWLLALYATAVFAPLTVQLLAKHARDRATWVAIAVVTGLFFYFGWHEGATQVVPSKESRIVEDSFGFAFPLTVLWLLMLPFIQGRLAAGHWKIPYVTLFAQAWRNKLVLAEAALFTGLFWLLLQLWQTLFHMLSIDFFRELFAEPIFVYPVTALTFGVALHLIGSIDRLTSVVLEQLLNVLKWLAVVAGVLLTLFTAALVVKLPGLISSGEKAIGAAWLLWLAAVVVLLLNAAYRDGSSLRPYPSWIAVALRFTVPLTIIVSATALYAMIVRTQHYGITPERVWAYVVAGTALVYTVGYSIAAFRRGPWMGGIARVNVFVAVALMFVIAVTLTPILSPRRLTANSQYLMALSEPRRSTQHCRFPADDSPFRQLRFESGTYGVERLKQLAALQNHPRAPELRSLAAAALAQNNGWAAIQSVSRAEFGQRLASIPIYPSGRTMAPALNVAITADEPMPGERRAGKACAPDDFIGLFVDLNGDGNDEFVLLASSVGQVYETRAGEWHRVGTLSDAHGPDSWQHVKDAAAKGDMSVATPKWNSLSVGGRTFRVFESGVGRGMQ